MQGSLHLVFLFFFCYLWHEGSMKLLTMYIRWIKEHYELEVVFLVLILSCMVCSVFQALKWWWRTCWRWWFLCSSFNALCYARLYTCIFTYWWRRCNCSSATWHLNLWLSQILHHSTAEAVHDNRLKIYGRINMRAFVIGPVPSTARTRLPQFRHNDASQRSEKARCATKSDTAKNLTISSLLCQTIPCQD